MLARKWESASFTHVGNVRKVNEDSTLNEPQLGMWAVADGMGGHSAGDVASQMIVTALGLLKNQGKLSEWVGRIDEKLLDINRRLLGLAEKEGGRRVIGSTVVALAAVESGYAVCAWVGDSRLYRLRGGVLEQLSQDHSQVEEMIMRNELLRENAEKHPVANVITRAIGGDSQLFVDFEWIELQQGDRYLLCSDGLYKELTDEAIGELLAEKTSPQLTAHALVGHALSGACKDNVSVVVVDI